MEFHVDTRQLGRREQNVVSEKNEGCEGDEGLISDQRKDTKLNGLIIRKQDGPPGKPVDSTTVGKLGPETQMRFLKTQSLGSRTKDQQLQKGFP